MKCMRLNIIMIITICKEKTTMSWNFIWKYTLALIHSYYKISTCHFYVHPVISAKPDVSGYKKPHRALIEWNTVNVIFKLQKYIAREKNLLLTACEYWLLLTTHPAFSSGNQCVKVAR